MTVDRQISELAQRVRILEAREGLLAAEFTTTATGTADVMKVVVSGYDGGEHEHGDPEGVVWEPRQDDDGDPVFPTAGDPAYVLEADDGTWIVAAWRPA